MEWTHPPLLAGSLPRATTDRGSSKGDHSANKSARFNEFVQWISFGAYSVIAARKRELEGMLGEFVKRGGPFYRAAKGNTCIDLQAAYGLPLQCSIEPEYH